MTDTETNEEFIALTLGQYEDLLDRIAQLEKVMELVKAALPGYSFKV